VETFYCLECGGELEKIIDDGKVMVKPCQTCIDAARDEANQQGFQAGQDYGKNTGRRQDDAEY